MGGSSSVPPEFNSVVHRAGDKSLQAERSGIRSRRTSFILTLNIVPTYAHSLRAADEKRLSIANELPASPVELSLLISQWKSMLNRKLLRDCYDLATMRLNDCNGALPYVGAYLRWVPYEFK